MEVSIPLPAACEAAALPFELNAHTQTHQPTHSHKHAYDAQHTKTHTTTPTSTSKQTQTHINNTQHLQHTITINRCSDEPFKSQQPHPSSLTTLSYVRLPVFLSYLLSRYYDMAVQAPSTTIDPKRRARTLLAVLRSRSADYKNNNTHHIYWRSVGFDHNIYKASADNMVTGGERGRDSSGENRAKE